MQFLVNWILFFFLGKKAKKKIQIVHEEAKKKWIIFSPSLTRPFARMRIKCINEWPISFKQIDKQNHHDQFLLILFTTGSPMCESASVQCATIEHVMRIAKSAPPFCFVSALLCALLLRLASISMMRLWLQIAFMFRNRLQSFVFISCHSRCCFACWFWLNEIIHRRNCNFKYIYAQINNRTRQQS